MVAESKVPGLMIRKKALGLSRMKANLAATTCLGKPPQMTPSWGLCLVLQSEPQGTTPGLPTGIGSGSAAGVALYLDDCEVDQVAW